MKAHTKNIENTDKLSTRLSNSLILNNDKAYSDVILSNNLSSCKYQNKDIPKNLLRQGGNLYWITLDNKSTSDLKSLFGVANLKFTKNKKVVIMDFGNYLDTFYQCEKSIINIRLFAGLRIKYILNNWKLDAGINNIPKLAAAQEFDNGSSNLSIEAIGWGFSDSQIDSLSNTFQRINVENFAKASNALYRLMTLYKGTSNVLPHVIRIK